MPIVEASVVIGNTVGLHARPATLLVQTAARYSSKVQVRCGEKIANAKSIVGILKLGAVKGDTIVLRAEGEDAATAIQALTSLVNRRFDEEELVS